MKRAWRLLKFATFMLGIAVIEGVLEAIAHEWMLTRRSKRIDRDVQRYYDEHWSRR